MMKNKVLSTIMTVTVLVIGTSQFTAMASVKDAVAQNSLNRSTGQSLSTPQRDFVQFEPVSPLELPTTSNPSFVIDGEGTQYPPRVQCKWLPWCSEEPEQLLYLDELRNNPNVPSDSQPPRTPRLDPSSSQLRRER